jgi:hypothetical protein
VKSRRRRRRRRIALPSYILILPGYTEVLQQVKYVSIFAKIF